MCITHVQNTHTHTHTFLRYKTYFHCHTNSYYMLCIQSWQTQTLNIKTLLLTHAENILTWLITVLKDKNTGETYHWSATISLAHASFRKKESFAILLIPTTNSFQHFANHSSHAIVDATRATAWMLKKFSFRKYAEMCTTE